MRPNTYEDAEEAEFMQTLFGGRSDGLENTTFCLLDADGKTRLSRGGRSAVMVFGGLDGMVSVLENVIEKHPPLEKPASGQRLFPLQESLALGLNVAQCDGLPLAVLVGGSEAERTKAKAQLAGLAFGSSWIGQLHYAQVTGEEDLALLSRNGAELEAPKVPELWLVRAEDFARKGEVVERWSVPASRNPAVLRTFADGVDQAWSAACPEVFEDDRKYIRAGERAGAQWESELPVTDPDATERGRGGDRDRRRR